MSEGNLSIDNMQTYVALPLEALQNATQKPEQFRIIKNAIIKTMSDGSLCIVDAGDFNEALTPQQIEIMYAPTGNNSSQNVVIEKPETLNNNQNQAIQKPSSPVYKCPKCKEVFDKIALYRKHMMWHRNVKKFKCDKCAAGYNVEMNLKIHMAMHGEGKPTCPICSISFQRLASLKSHLMLHQVEELYTCEECCAEFEKEEELNKHLQNHANNTVQENNNLICSYCNVQFEDRKSYKEHISHHIKVKKMVLSGKKSRKTNANKSYPHVCSVCLKSFSKLSLLERHLRVHSGERPFICEHCNKGFNQKGTLQIHLSKHTGIKPFHCTLCSAKFNQKGNLRVHVEKTHTAPMPGVKMYKCPHCTCIFKKIASLNVHITKCHASNEELGDISSVMNRLKELEQHTIITPNMKAAEKEVTEQNKKILNEIKKTGDVTNTTYVRLAESFLDGTVRRYLVMQKKINDLKWYICSYCNKEFKKPSDLIRHTRVHTREKPFSCKQCGASFALKSTLFYHVKTHVSNNYFCTDCKKKFSSMRSLNLHLRKHNEKPQYRCVPCNKWFTSIQKATLHEKQVHAPSAGNPVEMKQPLLDTPEGLMPLMSHKTTKENLKQYACPACNAKFTKMPNLKRHMLLHNGERKYKCDMCSKSYFTAHALKDHVLCHTGIRNFGCKVCGKKFMTASLLKRHEVSHSTSKPYVCPYCSKNFKSVMLCRKHMNIHKKNVRLQVHVVNDREGDLRELERTKLLELPHSEKSSVFNQENAQTNTTIEICNTNIHLEPQEDKSNQTIQEPRRVEQHLYEIPPNTIQIIPNSDKDLNQISNQVQTILINCDDLQLSENLYTQTTDTVLFNSLTDIQDTNTFTIDNLGSNFDNQNVEIYSSNEDQNKTVKVAKSKPDEITNNLPYYSQSELNLLFSLENEFETNTCDLTNESLNLPDINLNEVPILNIEPSQEVIKENTDKFSCTKCGKTFPTKKTLNKHSQTHKEAKKSESSIHQCSFCFKSFKKHSDLVRHIRTHTGEKPFGCDKCEKKFSLKSTLLSHQRTHNPVLHKQFSCVVCNSFFSSKSSLKVHMTVHTGDKAHKCNFCAMKFRTAAHRKSHENNYHVNPSKKRKNKVTNLLASVAMDVLNQQDQNDQVINEELENVLVVQEQFTGDSLGLTEPPTTTLEPFIFQQLQSNILLQDNFVPIQLDDGTLLSVKTVQNDQDNLIFPEKTKNFECDVCGKKYSSKDVLRKHKKIHDKKFHCSKCQKGFDDEEELTVHEKTHEGFRPFSCLYCANSFSKEHGLMTHMRRIHNISLRDLLLTDIK